MNDPTNNYNGKLIVILEGPDGAGKTTLAKKLLDDYNTIGVKATIVHAGAPEPDATFIWFTMVVPALAALEDHDVVIMDRSPLSEKIYGLVLRNKVIGTPIEWGLWKSLFSGETNIRVAPIILTASLGTLTRRAYEERGEDFVPPEHFASIVQGYNDYASTREGSLFWSVYTSSDEVPLTMP